ncbi:FAD-binding protein [Actinomyces vulturis]|uniref:FAD-binding protein n=1 Tax=Actinomyces vulturis TaxID=1857645 RepID=UPI00083633DA|nr:FAD-binding protein [Actinomyces vulturis]
MSTDSTLTINGLNVPVITTNTVVVGTGSAGYCAADRLVQFGQDDVVIVTDRIATGSSRNAGSDKQTYYKLTLAGPGDDSVAEMAQTLFAGGAMDGDNALVEAALSAQAFLHLVDLGVPFPRNVFGEYVGYKTDHDPRQRATSVGPYTSRTMVECLEKKVVETDGTRVVDNARIVDVLVEDGKVAGLLCLRRKVTDAEAAEGESRFLLIRAKSVIYATGGPAGMYQRSVFPHGQWGASGAAYRAGALGKNLTEWQFGLSSIAPRWNVSGTYMQVLPTFISTDQDGNDEREFLTEAIPDYGRQLSMIFLKGYQWPFDIRKARDGSSLIDLLVHRETVIRGRRVFLDFTRNPMGRELDPDALYPEAREYLDKAGVLFGTPVERLLAMNKPAYDLYLDKNPQIDLAKERLEVDVCVQHNNGGLSVDAWWQSNLEGFFPVGEAGGAHGVYRPGGSALNSTQVGATRAAQYIAARRTGEPLPEEQFAAVATAAVDRARALLDAAVQRHADGAEDTTDDMLKSVQRLMSEKAGAVRSAESVREARTEIAKRLADFDDTVVADGSSRRSIERVFLIRDILTTQYVYLGAMEDYLAHGGRSRGSVLYTDPEGRLPEKGYGDDATVELTDLPEDFRFDLDGGALDEEIQEVALKLGDDGSSVEDVECCWRKRRPIPDTSDDFFENIWRDFREDGNVH